MSYVLTIVARDTLSDSDIRQLTTKAPPTRLDHRAADLALADVAADLAPLRAAAQAAGFDAAIVPTANRQKRLLICDMDSTIIEQECIDELAGSIGIGAEISAITEQAMRGELDFNDALTARVGRLAGTDISVVDDLLRDVITLSPGAASLVATMKQAGAATALVSGGFTVFTGPVAERAGFGFHASNVLDVVGGKLSGKVVGEILGRAAKKVTLERLCQEHHISATDAVAIGDGANDLDMIKASGLGIAYHAKPAVAAAASASIDHTDLTAALYYQGLVPAERCA